MELANPIPIGKEMLQSRQFLDIVEVFEPVIVDFYAFYRVLSLEGVRVELLYFVVVHIELFQLAQLFQVVHSGDLVAGGFEDF